MNYNDLKKRYIGLDVLRIVSAVVICLFHTNIHLNCNYGILQPMITMGAVFMTAFFMLSGFCLFVNYSGKKLSNFTITKGFYLKRFIGIMPMYYIVALFYVIVQIITKKESIVRTLILAPAEFLGIQSVYSTLFPFSHNGGTWFISCILLCYFLYPLLQELIKSMKKRSRLIFLFVCIAILLYSPILVHCFSLMDIYSNPFFRILEFTIGILLAAMKLDYKKSKVVKLTYNWWTVTFVNIFMVIGVSIAVKYNIAVGNWMLYSWICLPCFCVILFGLSGVKSAWLEKSKLLKYMSDISYVFFLAQLFSNTISKWIFDYFDININMFKILISIGICIAISVCFRIIEVFINKKIMVIVRKIKHY